MPVTRERLVRLAAALLLVGATASCAYYNTFYLARRYYMKATAGLPYEVDREGTAQRSNYTKSGDYAKKLLGVYPRSKWVDDAWLMWARTLVGTDDPLKAVAMLEEFQTRFPKSDLRPDAGFFLGLAYRAARKHDLALEHFDEFLAQAPTHELVPYAYYERSKALLSLQRYQEAANSAGEVLQRFPRHPLYNRALRQRAEARFQQHAWEGAREDFKALGNLALTDDERLRFLLREVDCLESSHAYDGARALLRDARSHVPPPPPPPVVPRLGTNPSTPPPQAPTAIAAGQDQYGKLTLRMGGVELMAGRIEPCVEFYKAVLQDYPRTQLAAEAQYLIGYAYETGADDFTRARNEYLKVKELTGMSQFAQQAQQRLERLDRIDRFRTAGGVDSLARKAEARFLTAEHYLFTLERPERALEEYRAIADSNPAPTVRARALNAQAWVLSRKLNRKPAADSLFWTVVRKYPATEAQLAARDYLEAEGQQVPEDLIVAPKEIAKPLLEATDELTQPPGGTSKLGAKKPALIQEPGAVRFGPGVSAPAPGLGTAAAWRNASLPDSLRHAMALRDSLVQMARRDTSAAGRARVDSLRRALTHPDTTGRAAMMAELARRVAKADSVVLAGDDAPAPDLSAVDSTTSDAAVLPPQLGRNVVPPAIHLDDSRAKQPGVAAESVRVVRPAPAKVASGPADSAKVATLAKPALAKVASGTADSAKLAKPAPAKVASGPADSAKVATLAKPALAKAASGTADSAKLAKLAKAASGTADSAKLVKPALAQAAAPATPARTLTPRDSVRRARARLDSLGRAKAKSDSLHAELKAQTELRERLQKFDPLRAEAARRDSLRRARLAADSTRRAKASADSLRHARARADSLAKRTGSKPARDPFARPDSVRSQRP